jgi:hypothetical protein
MIISGWMFQTTVSHCCYEYTHSHMAIQSHYIIVVKPVTASSHVGASFVTCGGWRPNRWRLIHFESKLQKVVRFIKWNLQERGFQCLVEHHDIERVTSNEDRIHISCVVTIPKDDCIEVPPPSVQKTICKSVAAPSPCESCLPHRCRMLGDMSDMCRCGESILCDRGKALWPRSGV